MPPPTSSPSPPLTLPPPPPSPTQLQLRVHSASINPIDSNLLKGRLRLFWPLSFPHTPGCDISGTVTAVGSSITHFHPGDAVCGNAYSFGAYADLCNVEAAHVAPKPASITHGEAAGLGVAGQSALVALRRAEVGAGSKVVVVGASGGVGHLAVQMARAMGATTVVAVCSGRNAAFVQGLGATAVVDYTQGRMSAGLKKEFDAVIDCVGGTEQWDEATRVMRPGGKFVTIAGYRGGMAARLWGMVARGVGGLLGLGEGHTYQSFFLQPTAEQMGQVVRWVEEGKVKVEVEETFEFTAAGVKAMYAHIDGGRTRGKLAMKIRDD